MLITLTYIQKVHVISTEVKETTLRVLFSSLKILGCETFVALFWSYKDVRIAIIVVIKQRDQNNDQYSQSIGIEISFLYEK